MKCIHLVFTYSLHEGNTKTLSVLCTRALYLLHSATKTAGSSWYLMGFTVRLHVPCIPYNIKITEITKSSLQIWWFLAAFSSYYDNSSKKMEVEFQLL